MLIFSNSELISSNLHLIFCSEPGSELLLHSAGVPQPPATGRRQGAATGLDRSGAEHLGLAPAAASYKLAAYNHDLWQRDYSMSTLKA